MKTTASLARALGVRPRLLAVALLGLLMPLLLLRSYGGQAYQTLYNSYHGDRPLTRLLQGSDGNFYGTTSDSYAALGKGTVFKMTPTGVVSTLVEFFGPNGDAPSSRLVQGSDGNFYGTTALGGVNNKGTVFKMTPAGVHTLLVNFNGTNGATPAIAAGLVRGIDGNFYGTTAQGGTNQKGTVFKMTPAGVLTTLVSFDGTNGGFPASGVIQGSDGNFYGTTTFNNGTVFKMTPAGALTTLVNFDGNNGRGPGGGVIEGSAGNFYGTTDGPDGGTLFKMTPAGGLTTLVTFDDPNDNSIFPGALILGSDGNIYGTTRIGGANGYGAVFKMTLAGALTTLVNFDGNNGAFPLAGLTEGSDGNFYGISYYDGLGYLPGGSVFKMTPAGALTPLVAFASLTTSSFSAVVPGGIILYSGLAKGSGGKIYGTAPQGGTNGLGSVFKLMPSGEPSTVASFDGTNGQTPYGDLVKGKHGNFYGTTQGTDGNGTVFKMTPAGVLSSLAAFDATSGYSPSALLEGSDGNFYGTTTLGGANGKGTVFKLTPAGVLSPLMSFDGSTLGSAPTGLIQGKDGNFYGTTAEGGTDGYGTVFKMTRAGAPTTLVSFDGRNNGVGPTGLIQGRDGNFYGTTFQGGTRLQGTVFKMTPAGVLTVLAEFGAGGGSNPSKLVKGSDGNFYGTTPLGGPVAGDFFGGGPNPYGLGTVFRVTTAGALTTLVDFTALGSSGRPSGTLLFGSGGKLYGVAGQPGFDTILFRITFTHGNPTLTAPRTGTVTNGLLRVAFTLPEKALPGSVKLSFIGYPAGVIDLTLAASQGTKGAHSFTFDTANPTASPQIVSGGPINSLALPYFTLTLSYRDLAGNLGAVPFVSHLTIDRVPPLVSPLGDVVASATDAAGAVVNYATPATSDDDQYGNVTLRYSQASGTVFDVGTTKVTVTAEDPAHNQTTINFTVRVDGPFPAKSVVLANGDPAPGRATAPGQTGVPPEDAVLASFGVPAIDDAGNIAFTAKWTSPPRGKGSGLFTETACLGVSGGDVPGISGSTFKSFGDPVINGGQVACLATVTGTTKASVVLAGPVAGPLEVITFTGDGAPGLSDPFKSIKDVEVSGVHLAILATTGKTAGLWVKDGANPLALALLQGQTIGGKTIAKLISFAPGNGSPGCGRGWLRELTAASAARVLALCQFTDKSQAVVGVDSDDLANPVVLSQSGPGGMGGPAAGGSFASYSFPTANADSQSAFLASLPIGGAVTKANQRGIFAQLAGGGTYTLLAQTTALAGATGANFSLLKDPVLASDGGLAFPATIAGGPVKGAAMQTLWWKKPADTEPALFAQGDADAAELPGAKWKAFTSLAIAKANGPIFAATFNGGSGVWAADSTGAKRLLFRTGGTVTGKTLKKFTLLNATVGTTGVTRSFNDNGQVVWLATFTDKSQAIVLTEVP